jgi:hypothetical protein
MVPKVGNSPQRQFHSDALLLRITLTGHALTADKEL